MKLWAFRLFLAVALAAAGFWAWKLLFPGPEHVIRQELAHLAAAASIAPNEAPLTKLAKAQKLASFFSIDAEVAIDMPNRSYQTFNGREEIQQAAIGARALLNSLKVHLLDADVKVAPDKQSALVRLTATADLPGEKVPEVQELELRFKKIERDWLVSRVDTVKTLR
jgi:hypothetical protein